MGPRRKRGMGRCFQQLCCFITDTNQRTDDPEDFEEFCVNAHASHFLMDNAVLEMDDEDELFSQTSGDIANRGVNYFRINRCARFLILIDISKDF